MSKYTKNHTVYLNDDGEEIPSVTTILKVLTKPGLIHWANYLGFTRKKVDDVLDISSRLGTTVHQAIEAHIRGDNFTIEDTGVAREDVVLGLNNYFKWKKSHDIIPIHTELPMTSKRFGGTLDFYGEIDGVKAIIDFKTSKKIRMSMFLQLALYIILAEERGMVVGMVGIVLVGPTVHDYKTLTRLEMEKYIDLARLLIDIFHAYYDINLLDWKENISE